MSIRTERVASLFQREIAGILGTEFADQLHPMVTVTGVRVTADLSIAYVDCSVMGDTMAQKTAVISKLTDLTPKIRKSLGQAIRHQVKKIPELRFFLDETLEHASRMDELFGKIRTERSSRDGSVNQEQESLEDGSETATN
ncbi:MAG: 30S ribosome-binding factor RbfA [Bacteroidetes bacterium]|nr:30S ribosome-binding factor RbfA [Bacteroidota bacterium]MDA1334159.1 30S ribosome-binding factor RbfA [Bacteroidota bacterium]